MGAAASRACSGGASSYADAWGAVTNDFELVVRSNKALVGLLRRELGASGATGGLHECVSSVEARLPRELVRDLRFLATLRNKLVHEEGADALPDREAYLVRLRRAEAALQALLAEAARAKGGNTQADSGCVVS